jgi:hypothetical protein
MNDILYIFNILNIQMDETLFFNDICDVSVIHKNWTILYKITSR